MAIVIDDTYYEQLAQTVIDGNKDECVRLIEEGLAAGMDPLDAVEKGLSKGIMKVGDDFGAGIMFLPELIQGADIMKVGVDILDQKIKAGGGQRKAKAKIVIGTIEGDIHDIGKSVVAAVLQANGYDVVDIGIDVPKKKFIQAIQDHQADILAMSTLLTLPLMEMGKVIEELTESGLRDRVKVIVGGCPVTQEFAEEIGADAVGFDAQDAVRKCDLLIEAP